MYIINWNCWPLFVCALHGPLAMPRVRKWIQCFNREQWGTFDSWSTNSTINKRTRNGSGRLSENHFCFIKKKTEYWFNSLPDIHSRYVWNCCHHGNSSHVYVSGRKKGQKWCSEHSHRQDDKEDQRPSQTGLCYCVMIGFCFVFLPELFVLYIVDYLNIECWLLSCEAGVFDL